MLQLSSLPLLGTPAGSIRLPEIGREQRVLPQYDVVSTGQGLANNPLEHHYVFSGDIVGPSALPAGQEGQFGPEQASGRIDRMKISEENVDDDELQQFLSKLQLARELLDEKLKKQERLADQVTSPDDVMPHSDYDQADDSYLVAQQGQSSSGLRQAGDERLANSGSLSNTDNETQVAKVNVTNPANYHRYSVVQENGKQSQSLPDTDFVGQFGLPLGRKEQSAPWQMNQQKSHPQDLMKRHSDDGPKPDDKSPSTRVGPGPRLTTLLEDEKDDEINEGGDKSDDNNNSTVSRPSANTNEPAVSSSASRQLQQQGDLAQSGNLERQTNKGFIRSIFDGMYKKIGSLLPSLTWLHWGGTNNTGLVGQSVSSGSLGDSSLNKHEPHETKDHGLDESTSKVDLNGASVEQTNAKQDKQEESGSRIRVVPVDLEEEKDVKKVGEVAFKGANQENGKLLGDATRMDRMLDEASSRNGQLRPGEEIGLKRIQEREEAEPDDKKKKSDKVVRLSLSQFAPVGTQNGGSTSKRISIEPAEVDQPDLVWSQEQESSLSARLIDALGRYYPGPLVASSPAGPMQRSVDNQEEFNAEDLPDSYKEQLPRRFIVGEPLFGGHLLTSVHQQRQHEQTLEPAYAYQKHSTYAPLMLTNGQLNGWTGHDSGRNGISNDLYFLIMVGAFCLMAVAVVLAAGLFAYRIRQTRKSSQADTEYPTYGVVGPKSMGGKCGGPATFMAAYLANQTAGGFDCNLAHGAKLSGSAKQLSDLYAGSLAAGSTGSHSGPVSLDYRHHHHQQHDKDSTGGKKSPTSMSKRSGNNGSLAAISNIQDSASMYHYQHQKQQMIVSDRSSVGRHTSTSDLESEDENDDGSYTVYECPGLASAHEMEIKNPLFNDERTP